MRLNHLLYLSMLTAAAAFGQPSVTAVENAATNIPPGLPNSGIAQGALFVVKGANLGPATLAIAAAFPFTTNVGGTSIQVTVGGTTVDAIMYYSLATQVAAILPSKTPSGTGMAKVTYNGQSASGPITVVQNNIGIFTVGSTGSGDAIAFLPDNGLVSPSHAANPGDIVIFWGTGLGPVASDETQAAVQADMPNVPLNVFIGGKQANVLFRGRNACCTAVDTIYATVPQGVAGCAVSVLMQIGNLISNTTTIAVAASGRACTPINPNQTTFGTGTHSYGGLSLIREVISTNVGTFSTTTKLDAVGGAFVKITYSGTQQQGSQIDVNSYGSCTVSQTTSQPAPPPPNMNTVVYLDAGASIAMAAPFGNRPIPKTTPTAGILLYSANLDMTATTLTGGQYTFTGTGGADVGAFTANYTMPPPLVWNEQATITTVTRANGVTVTWSGGDPAGYVTIAGQSTLAGTTAATTVSVGFTCTARVSDGSFMVPPIVLLALPPSGTVANTNLTLPGSLIVSSFGTAQAFHAPGIELGGIASSFVYGSSVVYQ